MELKEYQQRTLAQVQKYLEALDRWSAKNAQVIKSVGPEAALDVPAKAWEEIHPHRQYRSRRNGLREHVSNFCLKIPTGGGKTFLAVKTIDLIQSLLRKRKTGFVLWIVPTTQIYRQTLEHLRDRAHPYRQHLDIASAGKTLLREKTDLFTPDDVAENLVVMLLMLPSASRETKETLRVFKDSGGFAPFFPGEDDGEGHAAALKRFPNLDSFGEQQGFFGRLVKTSLGNALRTLSPLIILDEGHKAYSEIAQGTLLGFNPCMIVELSATPKKESNVLVEIPGMDLAREEMIKLDLHLINKETTDWKTTLLASRDRRDQLEDKARELEANAGPHIRPICLIQVERTGRDQRGAKYIHAEDAREYLVRTCGIPAEQVAVKSSEKDDIEGLDLFARDCQVRYIITKQALQEGWDCSFAYVLTILTNPASKDNLTQLVGRILRQPYARKTGVRELDESYVYCFQKSGQKLLESVRAGFRQEGLGDLEGRVAGGDPGEDETTQSPREVEMRERFRRFAGRIYLPVFALQEDDQWRPLSYEMDLLGRVDWSEADFSPVHSSTLAMLEDRGTEHTLGLSEDRREVIQRHTFARESGPRREVDYVFVARQLSDIVPNPWTAFPIGKKAFEKLIASFGQKIVESNVVNVIERLRRQAQIEKDRLAETAFRDLIARKQLRFLLLKEDLGFRLPSKRHVSPASRTLTRRDGQPLAKSLFDFVPEEEFNEDEKTVAWCLEDQERLLFWYRNIARQDYAIQGWQRHRVYADFIASRVDPLEGSEYDQVFVVETKGFHLKGNPDTTYKEALFRLCNEMAEPKSWTQLGLEFPHKKVVFQIVYADEYRERINALFQSA